MGVIRQRREGGEAWYLRSSQWAGRDARCELRLLETRVSEVHASIAWDGKAWLLRDRNSRNGTFVNDVRLGLGARPLTTGDQVAFGGPEEAWVVDDDAAPGLILEPTDGGETRHISAATGSALLPSPDQPLLTVVSATSGAWCVETATDAWVLTDGAELTIGARRFRAVVPAPHGATEGDSSPSAPSLANAEIEIGVTQHEEEADLVLKLGSVSHRIIDRVPLYLLALLARARASRQDSTTAPAPLRATTDPDGWIGVEEVRRQLDVSPELLNVHVFRVRECLRELGIHDANQIIERRKGRMRIGLDPSRVRLVRVD